MGYGQMLLVMLAVVLFSSIILTTQNNLFTLAQSAYRAMIAMQGYKIADRFLQEIEALNISGKMSFDNIYNNFRFTDSLITINDIHYFVTSTTNWCNQYGGSPTDTLRNYMRADIQVNGVMGTDTTRIGTPEAPITNIYGKTGQ
ncbi:MAG: hypothetical protein JW996_01490 [Candidatus Cloacimonetes bacterium]|nr:hypothetical protein [Candidatus Cloacimonadota bacterium]